MGLDQYVYVNEELAFQLRKNYAVDEFFTNIFYRNPDNSNIEFNCREIEISKEDFELFKEKVLNFFSDSEVTRSILDTAREDVEYLFSENLELVRILEEAFSEEGNRVTYSNWW